MIFIYDTENKISEDEIHSVLGVEADISNDVKQVKQVLTLKSKKYSSIYVTKECSVLKELKNIPKNVSQYGSIDELLEMLGLPTYKNTEEGSSNETATTLKAVSTESVEANLGISIGGSYLDFDIDTVEIEEESSSSDVKSSVSMSDIEDGVLEAIIEEGSDTEDVSEEINVGIIADEDGFGGIDLESFYEAIEYNPAQERRAKDDILRAKDALLQEKDNEVFELSAKLAETQKQLEETSKTNAEKAESFEKKYKKAVALVTQIQDEKNRIIEQAKAEKAEIASKLVTVQKHFSSMQNALSTKGADICLKYLSSPTGVLGVTEIVPTTTTENLRVLAVASGNELEVITKVLGKRVKEGKSLVIADFTCGCVVNTAFNLKNNNSMKIESVDSLDTIGNRIENSIIFGSNIVHDIALLGIDWASVINKLSEYAAEGKEVYILLGAVSSFAVSHTLSVLASVIHTDVLVSSTPFNILSVYTLLKCGKGLDKITYKLLDTVPAVDRMIENIFKNVAYKMFPLDYDIEDMFDTGC